ncbi:hypothetical protein Patl1_28076 [Pistacia atlantica]|uniref:Uncharacterized protein n=1 Tax=Pistacia atlantica TaxID=434234 RepID=A0ACC1BF45_9ROSI|nr:hypothetical protein Patl1_28076 [Pistacia atlantica]
MLATDLSSSSLTLLLSIKQNFPIPTSHFLLSPSKSPRLFNFSLFLSKNAVTIRRRSRVFSQTQTELELATKVGQDRLLKVPASNIRNFSIIAHIDHGKSTLADKLLQMTGTAARMRYVYENEPYCLNLIDTPGHVDFSYEVSRSLAACEGALLVVDASQGVEAQTLANVYLALENNLEIIPVLNKIDLPGAEPDRVVQEIEEVGAQKAGFHLLNGYLESKATTKVVGLDCSDAILCSAKEGIGINEILNAIVKRIPPPLETAERPLRALIFDSYYDPYRGVIVYFRVIDGTMKKGDRIYFMASQKDYYVDEIGVLSPNQLQVEGLQAGEVGYLSASIRSVADARVGDTITHFSRKADNSLPGYEEATPMVFCGLFPVDADQFSDLRDALEKLQLNDAALKFEPETSSAMGFGFRCGFLGLLHMEIVQERLEREYNLSLITTAPSVVYRVNCVNGDTVISSRSQTHLFGLLSCIFKCHTDFDVYGDAVGDEMNYTVECSNPSLLPEPGQRRSIEEPVVKIEMLTPKDYIGSLMELAQDRRGDFKEMKFITEIRASITYELPLAEMVGDFFDQLKSRSKGYASMEYTFVGYKESELIKLDILINGDCVEPLATIVHRDKAYAVGRALTQKLKELIPRQMFKIPIQACIGAKVIASESLSAIRKDVLAKCYGKPLKELKLMNDMIICSYIMLKIGGGDISRKKKLLKKQAEGKKRMKAIGKVDVPQEAFMAVLKLEKEVL